MKEAASLSSGPPKKIATTWCNRAEGVIGSGVSGSAAIVLVRAVRMLVLMLGILMDMPPAIERSTNIPIVHGACWNTWRFTWHLSSLRHTILPSYLDSPNPWMTRPSRCL